ncbi:MAG: TolC family protein [Bacteroidetes bacterium]|nr:TolC family protein [Bacteroidota bacterium]
MSKIDKIYEELTRSNFKGCLRIIGIVLLMINQLEAQAQNKDVRYFLENAKSNSPVLREYQNNASVADLENEKVISDYRYPAVHADVNWMEAPVIKGVGYDEAITNGAWYSALAGVSMSLFTKALSQPELEKNNLQAGKSKWLGKMGWKELSMQITDLYAQCFADQQNLDNLKDQMNVITDQHRLARKLAEQGIVRASDVLQLGIEVSAQKVRVKDQRTTLRNNLNKLNTACGISDTTLYRLADPALVLSVAVSDSSLFLKQFYYDSLSILNQQDLFNLKYIPKLSAFADAGLNASKLTAPQNNLGFSFGLNLNVKLWDHGQRKINEKQSQIRMNTVSSYKSYFQNQRTQQLNSILVRIRETEEKITELAEQLKQYETLLAIYKTDLSTGDITMNEFLVVFRNSLKARQAIIQQQLNKNNLINAYNYWNW